MGVKSPRAMLVVLAAVVSLGLSLWLGPKIVGAVEAGAGDPSHKVAPVGRNERTGLGVRAGREHVGAG